MEFLSKFNEYDAFEKFCRGNKKYCPAKDDEKAKDSVPICHWCRVSFSHAISILKHEFIKRIQD
jgi:hypothetical protein